MRFSDLALQPQLLRALEALNYSTPTPIQEQAIPSLLDGHDLLGIAQTGTGKTAGFALPTLDLILTEERDPPKRGARVLVLGPTRELVAQIADSFVDYGRFIDGLSVARVTGGVALGPQIKKLVGGNDVIVATPGRLIDLLDRKAVRLDGVEVLILDEADQMMDMGFIHALKKIIPHLPKERQTLLFSATLPPKIQKLAGQFLTDPVKVSVTPANSTAEKVVQSLSYVASGDKPLYLAERLLREGVGRALVFTRTKHGADRLVKRLAKMGIASTAIHGNKGQGARRRALDAFREGKVMTLVATDVAARGIDIPGITHVFNYEIPNVPEQYVHRIGRTARADAEGEAVAFVAPDEKPYLKDIQKLLGETIPVEADHEDLAERLAAVRNREAIPVLRLSPEQPARQGRGKSKKKKNANRSGTNAAADADGSKPGRNRKRGRNAMAGGSKPQGQAKSSAGKAPGGRSGGAKSGGSQNSAKSEAMSGKVKDGYRGRVKKNSPRDNAKDGSGARSTTRRAAPKRR